MLKIALIGDLHYPAVEKVDDELWQAREKFFKRYFSTLFKSKADYYVSIGDLTHNGLSEEFEGVKRYLGERDVDFRFVLGNHDVLSMTKSELLPYVAQASYYAIETEQALLLFLDTTKELELHGWGIDTKQWEWLEKQMKRSPHKTMIVFAHHPIPGTTISSPSGDAEFKQYQDIRSIFKQREGTILYCNGHTHTHSIVNQGNFHFIQTVATYCHPSFYMIHLEDSTAKIKVIEMNDKEILRNGKFLHDKLEGFHRPESIGEIVSKNEYTIPLEYK